MSTPADIEPKPSSTNDKGKGGNPGNKKKEKTKPDGIVIPPPKPKLSKAERRALQEQQRAAKGGGGGGAAPAAVQSKAHDGGVGSSTTAAAASAASATKQHGNEPQQQDQQEQQSKRNEKTVSLVSHLSPYRDPAELFETGATLAPRSLPTTVHHPLHPAVVELGYLYATGTIRGGNARCRAMLDCFATVISDYVPPGASSSGSTPSGKTATPAKPKRGGGSAVDVRQSLDHDVLKPSFQYWTERCRPHSVGMGNAFTFLKTAVASLDREMAWPIMQQQLRETLAAYAQERIDFATQAIAELACTKILQQHQDDDDEEEEVMLTYGNSEVVRAILQQKQAALTASSSSSTSSDDVLKSPSFRVIVVDSRPLLEGRQLLEDLRRSGIECTYVLLNALTYVLQDNVTKVLLGASALMSDGSVLGRVGSACVALAAHDQHIPVLVCSETYKISNRIQLESITGNELGDPETLVGTGTTSRTEEDGGGDDNSKAAGALADWKEVPKLKLLNLMYDLTPADFVSGIVTEFGIVPPTSVAVLLREMYPQDFKGSV